VTTDPGIDEPATAGVDVSNLVDVVDRGRS
jgi:hypothetical protein